MSATAIALVVTGSALAYLFAAGVAYGFAREWLDGLSSADPEWVLLAAFWPAYLAGFVVYKIAATGAALPRWSASLVANRRLPKARVVERES